MKSLSSVVPHLPAARRPDWPHAELDLDDASIVRVPDYDDNAHVALQSAEDPVTSSSGRRGVTESRQLLQHFIAALAYRTQKALRDAPGDFPAFCAAPNVRTPHELLWHMTGVIGYARTMLWGGEFAPARLDTFDAEVQRFHDTLGLLQADFGDDRLEARISDEQFLQGPLSDAMTHAGQLAMLRRLAGSPVPSENFIFATIDRGNTSALQAEPAAPDLWWRPDLPPPSPRPGNPYDGAS